MKQTAVVTKVISSEYAEISVTRKSACSADCDNCHGCAHPEEKVTIVAKNVACADVGDTVTVESSTSVVIGWTALIYLFPVLLMFGAYFIIPATEGIKILASLAGLALGFFVCRWISEKVLKKKTIKFIITEKTR